jgi:hypothetical protein
VQKEIIDDAGFDMASSKEEVNAAVDRLNLMSIEFHQMLEKAGINDFEEDIQRRAGASSGGGGGTPSGIDLNPDLTALVNKLAQ